MDIDAQTLTAFFAFMFFVCLLSQRTYGGRAPRLALGP